MAKKKRARSASITAKSAEVKRPKVAKPKSKKKAKSKQAAKRGTARKKKERMKMSEVTLTPAAETPHVLIPQRNRDSLTAWLSLYMKIDGEACAEQTRIAKTQDLERFLDGHWATRFG